MKKKLLSLLLAGVLAFGSVGCVSADELGECTSSFSVAPIDYMDRTKKISFTITIPKTHQDGLLLMAFYTNDQMTKLTQIDISQSLKISKQFYLVSYLPSGIPTPDRIKLFTWNKDNIMPLTVSEDALTSEVIESANADVVTKLLDRILGNTTTNTYSITQYLRDVKVSKEHQEILKLLDQIDLCAREAMSMKDNYLLTSELVQKKLAEEIAVAESIYYNAPETQKKALQDIYMNLDSEGLTYMTISNLLAYFQIDINLDN